MRVLVAPDKLRGTLSARATAEALAEGLAAAGAEAVCLPLSDGGEGFLDALGGPNRTSEVRNAFGAPAIVGWRLSDERAVIESALVIGHVPGIVPDPVRAESASSHGVGELIAAALCAGARQVSVGLGGSATTDGGAGALVALGGLVPFDAGCEIVLAADVTTGYVEAARVFAPQKGADPAAVVRLEQRLVGEAELLRARFGREVRLVPGSGAAGGLAGGLWAAGARLVPGFEFVAGHVGLTSQIAGVDLVVTAEGHLDSTSLAGKVVGGVLAAAARAAVPAVVVAGQVDREVSELLSAPVIVLSEQFGMARSTTATADCLRMVAALVLATVS
jgi:glycerate kinase